MSEGREPLKAGEERLVGEMGGRESGLLGRGAGRGPAATRHGSRGTNLKAAELRVHRDRGAGGAAPTEGGRRAGGCEGGARRERRGWGADPPRLERAGAVRG